MYTNYDMRQYDLPMGFGFKPLQRGREHWSLKENQTPSIRDAVFQEARENQIGKADTKKTDKAIIITIDEQTKATQLIDSVARIELSRQPIIEHFEAKISAFLMQIIDCYDTDYYFTVGKTESQTESTSAVHFVCGPNVHFPPHANTEMLFASAHHGAIPCLYAYNRKEWEDWKALGDPGAPNKPQAVVYFKNSDTYYLNNACTGVEKVVNEVDIDIDGNATENLIEFGRQKSEDQMKLREYAIKLLNKAAHKEITPLEGFSLFLTKFESIIIENCNHLQDEHRAISRILQQEMQQLQDEYQGRMKFCVARLLGIHISRDDLETINLEAIVFPRQYRIIQQKNFYQNQLSAHIEILANQILQQTHRKPKTFEKALKVAMMEEANRSTEKLRLVFQRYYNLNATSVEQLKQECFKPAKILVEQPESKRLIKEMITSFHLYLHNFSVEEACFRSGLLKAIRTTRMISLRTFSSMYNCQFPQAHKLNHEQLRRIEGGHVKITSGMIERFAAVLEVPANYFITNFSELIQ